MKNFTTWADVKDNLMAAEEIFECDKWLAELGILMDKLDAGKITEQEYRNLCFELDKKYNLAKDTDADFYVGTENDEVENSIDDENNLIGQIAIHF